MNCWTAFSVAAHTPSATEVFTNRTEIALTLARLCNDVGGRGLSHPTSFHAGCYGTRSVESPWLAFGITPATEVFYQPHGDCTDARASMQ